MAVNRSRRSRAARKRKRRMDSVEHDLTAQELAAITEAWGGCAYCGATDKPLQRDCVLPLSRGGRYTLDNIAPACPACNASKCNDEVTGWLRRKRLDERAFLVRQHEITSALRLQFRVTSDAVATAPGPPDRGSTRSMVDGVDGGVVEDAAVMEQPLRDLHARDDGDAVGLALHHDVVRFDRDDDALDVHRETTGVGE